MPANEMIASLLYDGRTYYNSTPEDLRAAGVPDNAITAGLAAERLTAIKAECKARIYAKASPETQMNMVAAATAVAAKNPSSRTADDNALLSAHADAVAWVEQMRATVPTLAADPASDFKADASWPVPSAAAVALADEF